MRNRKRVTMTVTVTVPPHLSAAQARREVRTLINHQCNYLDLDERDVRAVGVKAAPR